MSEWVSELWVREREREREREGRAVCFQTESAGGRVHNRHWASESFNRVLIEKKPGVKDPEGLNLSELRTGLSTLSGSSVGTDLDPDSS